MLDTILPAIAGLTLVGVFWLAAKTGGRGSAGFSVDVLIPLLLAGLTVFYVADVLAVCGISTARYQTALEGLFFRSLWLGLLLDQTSWVQRTTLGLRGRRATLPVLVWGMGFVILMLAPLAARGQTAFLAALDKAADGPDMRDFNPSDFPSLLADWGLLVAQVGLAMMLVGAFALATQAVLWIVRIAHAYLFTQVVEADSGPPSYAPGCFQSFFGIVVGVAGIVWLVWATAAFLRG